MCRRLRLKLIPVIPILSIVMAAAPPNAESARPGTLNAIAGEVSINGVPVNPISGPSIALEGGGVIRTGQGMAEILLSPGSVLRLGTASELTLETAGTPGVRARLRRGEALLEVLATSAVLTMEQNGVTAM